MAHARGLSIRHSSHALACLTGLWVLLSAGLGWTQEEAEYRLGREDLISILVRTRDDLSGQVAIDQEGRILVPFLDPVVAEGLTPEELAELLTRQYRIAFDTNFPKVIVTVADYRSRRVNVVGEVRTPGPHSFRTIPGLWDVILAAGGTTPAADLSSVQIVRKEAREGEPRTLNVDLSSAPDGVIPDSLPSLLPLDTVNVPSLSSESVVTGASFQVLGSVRTPGIYRLTSAETLAEALAVAGGPLPEANLRKVHLTRKKPDGVVAYELDLESYLYEGRAVSDLQLQAGDTVTIPGKSFSTGSVARGLVLFLPLVTSLTSLIVVLDR